MARQHERLTLATKLNQHVALIGALGPKAHIAQRLHQIISRRTGIAVGEAIEVSVLSWSVIKPSVESIWDTIHNSKVNIP